MIIGFTGAAGSGKDTAADYLVSQYGFIKVSFAAILKNMLSVAGLPEPSNRDDKEKNVEGFNFTWREAAQTLGTEWGRNLDENIWVKLTMAKLDSDKNYVFSDVRFDNEAQAIIRSGSGINFKVCYRSANLGENSNHASEQGVSGLYIGQEIDNSGDITKLYAQLDNLVKLYKKV
jgi:hypothetical protein